MNEESVKMSLNNVYKDTENNLIFDIIEYGESSDRKDITVYANEDYELLYGKQCVADEIPESGEYYVVDRLPDDEYFKSVKNTEQFKQFIYALNMKRIFSNSNYKRLIYYNYANGGKGIEAYIKCNKNRTAESFITSAVLVDELEGDCEISLSKASKLTNLYIGNSHIDLHDCQKFTLKLPDIADLNLQKFGVRGWAKCEPRKPYFNITGCSKDITYEDSVITGVKLNSGLHITPIKLDVDEVIVDGELYINLNRQNLTTNTLFIVDSKIKKLILAVDGKVLNEYDNITFLKLDKAGKGSPNIVVKAKCNGGNDYKVIGMNSK